MIIQSSILDLVNNFYSFFQNKIEKITGNSFLLGKIDDIVLILVGITLLCSTFMQSEQIGMLAIFVIVLSILKLFIKKNAKVILTGFDAAILVYFLICFISTVNSTLFSQSVHGFLKTVIYIFYYFSVVNYFQRNQSKIKYILLLVSGLCFVEGIIAIYQNFAGVEQISTWQDSRYINPEDAIARAYGTLKPYNPNLLGGYLIVGIPFIISSVAISLVDRNYKALFFTLFSIFVSTFAVFATGCRGAYLGLAAIIAGMIFVVTVIINSDFKFSVRLKSIWHKVIVAIISMFVLVLIAVPKITKRIFSIFLLRGDSSTSFRMNVYHSSIQMFCDNWFLGIGAGNQTFREIYGLYMITGFDALSTYSVPLEIAVEAGIFALLAFAIFIGWFLWDSYSFIRSENCTNCLSDKAIVCGSILVVLGVMMHGMFDTIYFRPQVQFLFWTMIAMSSAVVHKKMIENIEV